MTRPPLVDDALCRLAHAQDAPSRALVEYVRELEAENGRKSTSIRLHKEKINRTWQAIQEAQLTGNTEKEADLVRAELIAAMRGYR
jgi:hypothetical protein